MDDRLCICNMAIEAGAKNGIFPVDEVTKAYLKGRSQRPPVFYEADLDAEYEKTIEIDLSALEPTVSYPHLPENTHLASEGKDIKIDQVVIGSCTNGRLEDMEAAYNVLKGKHIAKGVRGIIIPATMAVYKECILRGWTTAFIDAGCIVSTPTCGPCLGGYMGILAEGERCVSTTIEVKYNTNVGVDIPIEEVRNRHDAMFVAIGAQKGKKLRLDGIDANNVFSAVEMLDGIGHGIRPDYTGKTVAVIGGGNVAMDAARSALRCGAKDVRIVYRRRQEDMTALDTEIESAVMEGIELMLLQAPKSIEKDENGDCCALWVQPQMIGAYRGGRPSPVDSASKDPLRVPCDVVLIAVGQDIVSEPFEEFGMPAEWHVFKAGLDTAVEGMPGVFVGGDCATGPSTAIKAIAAGKVAAHNIDEYLGYHHTLNCGVEAPEARENNRVPTGRVNIGERPAYERKHDFEHVECPMTHEEAMQESADA